jgi:membrane peptidoglycan carboxypeptidase
MRTGFVRSLNVVTVDVALQTGLARIANLANRFGLPKPERYPGARVGHGGSYAAATRKCLRGFCK